MRLPALPRPQPHLRTLTAFAHRVTPTLSPPAPRQALPVLAPINGSRPTRLRRYTPRQRCCQVARQQGGRRRGAVRPGHKGGRGGRQGWGTAGCRKASQTELRGQALVHGGRGAVANRGYTTSARQQAAGGGRGVQGAEHACVRPPWLCTSCAMGGSLATAHHVDGGTHACSDTSKHYRFTQPAPCPAHSCLAHHAYLHHAPIMPQSFYRCPSVRSSLPTYARLSAPAGVAPALMQTGHKPSAGRQRAGATTRGTGDGPLACARPLHRPSVRPSVAAAAKEGREGSTVG